MSFDYSKLRGRMREKDKTFCDLASEVGISSSTFSQKINNHAEFKQCEIASICKALDIAPQAVNEYFFVIKV